ncbi:MAG: Ig-like domain-containing protein, partial [Thermoanaerobaculia bacterium]
PASLPVGYNGGFYPQTAAASSGFTGTLWINGTTGVVTVTNAGPVGDYTITVSSSTSCGSPATTFTLQVTLPPANITATSGSEQSARVNKVFDKPLRARVTDSDGKSLSHVVVKFTAPSKGASAVFNKGSSALTDAEGIASVQVTANETPGSYTVQAVVGSLTATFELKNTR